VTILGSGGNAQRGSEPNTTAGFTESGFRSTVEGWLSATFPTRDSGGFLCVIDNLELLDTSQGARALLEAMRDTVLDQPGLRWVLAGARGIIRTAAASPRLEGRLAEPLELLPIGDDVISEVIDRRIETYRTRQDALAPVGAASFRHLYDVVNRNLRTALKFAEDFSFWLYDQDGVPPDAEDYARLLEVWLTDQADKSANDTVLTPRAWELFDTLSALGGSCSPSDFQIFGFNSPEAMRSYVKALEDANLAVSTRDDTDKRRKTIGLTPRGWLVRYARSGYQPPTPR
jgi:hypothetical protein